MVFCLLPGISSAGNAKINSDDIVIIYTNDVHCGAFQVKDAGGNVTNIGYAGLAAYKAEMEALVGAGNVTLIDAGDAVQGDALGTLSKGQYIVDIMNMVGYDVFVPGNHEFDYGMDQMLKLMEELDAEVISSNFIDLEADAPVYEPYTVVTYGTVQVAYVGITTPESFTKSTPVYFQNEAGEFIYGLCEGSDGDDLYDAVQAAVNAAITEGGADYVVAVGHMGIVEQSEPWRSVDVIANTTGIDAFIDGHSHSVVESEIIQNKDGDDVILTQTGTKLANIGCMTISSDGEISAGLISGYDKLDFATDEFISEIVTEFEDKLAEVVATADVGLTVNDPLTGIRMVRSRETNLGDLCADAYRFVLGNGETGAQSGPADIAFVNGGGVRADVPAGNVTFGQVIAVHPFNNAGCVVEATGREILDALEMASRSTPIESGGFLHVSGMSYTIDTTVVSSVEVDEHGMFVSVTGERRVKDVKVGGIPIDENKIYTLASHNYMLLDGGDGINMFRDNNIVVQPVILDNQVLISYIQDYLGGVVGSEYATAYGQGRVTVKAESYTAGFDNSKLAANQIMRYSAGAYDADGGVTEIVAYSPFGKNVYVVNGKAGFISSIDLSVLDENTMAMPGGVNTDIAAIAEATVSGFAYGDVTSVAVSPDGRWLAAAVQHEKYDERGLAGIFEIDSDGSLRFTGAYEVGVQPDMIVFANNTTILTADEGEPREGYGTGSSDPKGSVTVINLADETSMVVDFTKYDAERDTLLRAGIVMKKGAAPSVDFEPEYIAIAGETAYVTLQESNAVAVFDITSEEFTGIYPLGVQDYSEVAIDLDNTSDTEGAYSPRYYDDTFGLRMPDGIAAYQADDKTYIVTANEGDSRDWPGYINEDEYKIIASDGSETTKKVRFLSDDYEGLPGLADGSKNYLFGSRSFSVFEVTGTGLILTYDSGADFENLTAEYIPDYFNVSNDDVEKDSRSNKKGPEPETVAVGVISGKTYAFVTLERPGGIMVYDVTSPDSPEFVNYINSRDFDNFFNGNGDGIGFDNSAEGLTFIPAASSPTNSAVLLAAFEVSGNVSAYSLIPVKSDVISIDDMTDVIREAWYYDAISYVLENGVMHGTSATTFEPDGFLSRAMMVQMLWNLEGQPKVSGTRFADVKEGQWYTDAITWAAENNIVNGIGDNLFAPEQIITREQMVVMLYNYCEYKGLDLPVQREDSSFADIDAVSAWALEAVQATYQAGIFNGKDNNLFDPQGGATRAEGAQMFMNFMRAV